MATVNAFKSKTRKRKMHKTGHFNLQIVQKSSTVQIFNLVSKARTKKAPALSISMRAMIQMKMSRTLGK